MSATSRVAAARGAQTPQLHWVNTLLGNLKTSMAGTYHSFDHAKYAARYLAEFCYRFNRRFDLPTMLPRLLRALVSTRPFLLKVLRVSEVRS
ncbi:MAG: transposase [Acidovorax defluvii]